MPKQHDREDEKTPFGGLNRSELMSRIKSKGNLSTELRMITLLRKNGLKGWRRNYKLEGNPDFVWRAERVVLFVDGCFWHGHDCGRNLRPKKNTDYWKNKISKNKIRDDYVNKFLKSKRWKVIRIWECVLKKNPEECASKIAVELGRV